MTDLELHAELKALLDGISAAFAGCVSKIKNSDLTPMQRAFHANATAYVLLSLADLAKEGAAKWTNIFLEQDQ